MSAKRIAAAGGAALAAIAEGSGPAVLLVSGLGGTAGFWQPVVDDLAGEARLIRFDQRGIGASTAGKARSTIAQLADDALAVLDVLCDGPAVAVGHSTGGCIVQEMALRAPERVSALVLSGAWLAPNAFMAALFSARVALMNASPEDYARLGVLMAYPPQMLFARPALLTGADAAAPLSAEARRVTAERIEALLSFDASSWTAELTQPRLVIGAEDDMIVPAVLQRALADAAPCALHMLESGGHFFPQTQTAEFCQVVRDFVAMHAAP